jgi:hypothetical protein
MGIAPNTPANAMPSTIVIEPKTCCSTRWWVASNCPRPPKNEPSPTKITLKPRMNSSAPASVRDFSAQRRRSASETSAPDMPVTYDR